MSVPRDMQAYARLRYCMADWSGPRSKGARLIDIHSNPAVMTRENYHAWFAANVVHHYYPRNDGPNPYKLDDEVEVLIDGHFGRGEADRWVRGVVTQAGVWWQHYSTVVRYEGERDDGMPMSGMLHTFATSRSLRPVLKPVATRRKLLTE